MEYLYKPLEWIMNWCYALCHNYGMAVILFTFISKIVLLPITIWVLKNSIKILKMQPEINFLKVNHFGDKDTIAEKQAELYKKEKYNPFASMVPLAVQIVLLMGLIAVIKAGIEDPTINMDFLGTNLSLVPSVEKGWLILSPIAAGISAWIMCFTQNLSSVLQAEQSKANKYGTMAFSVALSIYLGWFVPVGVAVYWVASNLMSVAFMYLLNWIFKPRSYVDYEKLEESRKQLAELGSVGKKEKHHFWDEVSKRERADYKRFFSIVNKHVVFYSENSGFYKYFRSIIEYLLEHTNITIHYVTSDPNDQIFDIAKEQTQIRPYYIGEKKLITLMMKMDADVVLMTMPDLENFHIKRSYIRDDIEYIFVQHGMGSNNMGMRRGCTDHFDTVFCVGKHQRAEEEQIGALYKLPERTLVDLGYPMLDEMRNNFNQMTHEVHDKKKILIAPSWQKDNIVDSCLEELLDQLKDSEYEVIVRPHPQEVRLKHEYMETLKKKYEPAGIEIQTDFSSNNPVMEADLLITDWSGITWEYAFTTLRPVLFINTPMKVMNPEYEKIREEPLNIKLRDQLGKNLNLNQLDQVRDVVDELLSKPDEYHNQIDSIVHEYIYNLGSSAEVGGKYIIKAVQQQIAKKREANI